MWGGLLSRPLSVFVLLLLFPFCFVFNPWVNYFQHKCAALICDKKNQNKTHTHTHTIVQTLSRTGKAATSSSALNQTFGSLGREKGFGEWTRDDGGRARSEHSLTSRFILESCSKRWRKSQTAAVCMYHHGLVPAFLQTRCVDNHTE